MSHLLDELLAQAANGSPITAALSSESVAVLFFASEFLGFRDNWLDRGVDPLDEVTDADWDAIEKLVGNCYEELMTPIDITPVGALTMWAAAAAPTKWLLCQGQSLLRTTYPLLFAVIGTVYGAADSTHFTLPDLRNRSPLGIGGAIVPNLANTWGAATHSMLLNDLVSHSHAVTDPGHTHAERLGNDLAAYKTAVGSGGFAVSGAANNTATRINTDSNTTGISIGNAGSGNPFNIVHPVLGVNFIIYAGE